MVSFLNWLIKAHVHVNFSSASELAMLPQTRLCAFLRAKELSWGFFLICLGLGRALEVVVVDAVPRHYKGRLKLLGLNVRGAGIAILQAKRTTDASSKLCFASISPLTKTDMRKKSCLMLMLLSHVGSQPPFLPNGLSLCSVRLTS